MRKVVGSLFISLDGVVEAPDQWQFDVFDGDMMNEMTVQLDAIDTILLGRVTYDYWAPYWPTATDEPFASWINNTPKYVVSTTLDTVSWGRFNNVQLIKGDVASAITQLKQQPGKNIGVAGSPGLVASLLHLGLLDVLHLQIHPVVAGSGNKHLFKDDSAVQQLQLIRSKTTSTGVLMVSYQPRQS